jgi:hypothetical protein
VSPGGIRPRLVTVWLVLLALVGTILAVEHANLVRARSGGDGAGDPRRLVPVGVDQLGAIEVAHAGTLHRFERDATGAWFYHGVHTGSEGIHAHTADPAMAGRIERAVAAFGRTRIERQFGLHAVTADYGVTTPETLILIYRRNDPQPLAQYAVGDIAPDTMSRYVLVVGSSVVATIPSYQIDNLLALIQAVGGPSDRERATGRPPARRGGSTGPAPRGGVAGLRQATAMPVWRGRGGSTEAGRPGGSRRIPGRARRWEPRAALGLSVLGPPRPRPLVSCP